MPPKPSVQAYLAELEVGFEKPSARIPFYMRGRLLPMRTPVGGDVITWDATHLRWSIAVFQLFEILESGASVGSVTAATRIEVAEDGVEVGFTADITVFEVAESGVLVGGTP